MANVRIGLFGIGLDAYWPQFPGLKERLEGYIARVADRLARPARGHRQPGSRGQPRPRLRRRP